MKYQTQLKVVEADQYQPGKKLDIDVELIKYERVTGYAGKLAYLKNERGELVTIRPSDWIVLIDDNPPEVMDDKTFNTTYELTKQVKRAKKSASVADNAPDKAPGTP